MMIKVYKDYHNIRPVYMENLLTKADRFTILDYKAIGTTIF